MSLRVLVTGGAGYVGSVVVDHLVARGYAPVVIDDLSRGHRQALHPELPFVEANVGDRAVVDRLLREHRIEAIVHLAAFALVAESVAHPALYQENNLDAGRRLLEVAEAAGVRRFVFSSSCAVYGHPPAVPIIEDAPKAPISPYGQTKLEFEGVLDAAAARGLEVVSLRYFNAAGATARLGEDHSPESHLIPNVLAVPLGRRAAVDVFGTDYPTRDGTAVRDYIHVEDLADAHVRALTAAVAGMEVCNLGTGSGFSVREVVETARRVTGHAIPAVSRPRRSGDPPELVASAERARRVLGWRPEHSSLEEIVDSAWRWHRAHPGGYSN